MEHEDQYHKAPEPKYEWLLFDLDDTLYPLSSGLSMEITNNIREYMREKLGIGENEIPELCASLYRNYGTTMAGLRAMGYNFDYDDFHSLVHGRLPYNILKPDPVLRSLLLSVPVRKVIFTNSDKAHASRVLSRLGLEDCFEGIICFETLNPTNKACILESSKPSTIPTSGIPDAAAASELPKTTTPVVCKPFEDAFEQAFKIATINPQKTLFVDDNLRNLQMGKRMGLHTVLVGSSHRTEGVDYALESIHNIREALPELWEANEKSESVGYSGKLAIETSVRA